MDWMCDVYVYEDVGGGWTVHVANNRRPLGSVPKVTADILVDVDEFARQNQEQMASLDKIESKPIGLSRDGESFNVPTPGECADLLVSLRDEGYVVPDYAIDALREEQAVKAGEVVVA